MPCRFHNGKHSQHQVFVFGSNLKGVHGAGAALYAKIHCGAKMGVGEGMAGQSYALPTKDWFIKTLPLEKIKEAVDRFIEFVKNNEDKTFFVTALGTGLAGYRHDQIAPMFTDLKDHPNVVLPREWAKYIMKEV